MLNKDPDFIFFDFFQKLRKDVGIDLDLDQYQLFVKSFLSNPIIEIEELRFFLQTIWLTKDKFRLEFDRYFNETITKHLILPTQTVNEETKTNNDVQKELLKQDAGNEKEKNEKTTPEITEKDKNQENNTETQKQITKTTTTAQTKQLNININDIGGNSGDLPEPDFYHSSNFILSEFKYLPFNSRVIEQGWRKMRGKEKVFATDQIDVKNIIKLRSQQGFIENLLYEKKSKGIQKVIWFTDNGGSMAPFSYWDDQLFEIMKDVPNTEKPERFFFHDFPSERTNKIDEKDYLFFTNRSHTEAKYLSDIIKKADKDTIFLICSDGGAARKREDMERVEIFFKVCNILRTKSRNVAWINPVKNIDGSSAKYISFFVKTEYPSNKGIGKLMQTT